MTPNFGLGLKILVVDTPSDDRDTLIALLEQIKFDIVHADSMTQATGMWSEGVFDLAIINTSLPDGSGFSLVQWIFEGDADGAVILTTENASIESILEAMQLNVGEYLMKPYTHLDEVRERIKRVVENLLLKRKQKELNDDLFEKNKQLQKLADELLEKNRILEAYATKDVLTGLANHTYFQARLNEELARCSNNDTYLSIVLIDIDRFNAINDSHGHHVGNEILQLIASALKKPEKYERFQVLEKKTHVSARYAGDQIIILLPEVNKYAATAYAEEFRGWFEKCDDLQHVPYHTVSIGVASFPTDAGDRDSLLKAADQALFFAKQGGRNRVTAYTKETDEIGAQSSTVGKDYLEKLNVLEKAIIEHAFNMVYQPIVNAASVEIYGYEALVRPRVPEFPTPKELFETATSTGKLFELGRVLREITFEPIGMLKKPRKLFINLHPGELNANLLKEVENYDDWWPPRVVLEVTETTAISDYKHAISVLKELKGFGFEIALDDLGSGYSGLNTLVRLQPHYVKLDMEMLHGIKVDSTSSRLIRHILEYAKGEGMLVVAEGIETDEQRSIVTDIGCPLLQGFFFERGQPPFVEIDTENLFQK